ncbi:Rv3654c family TadE-like protein [Zhihengliuella flava]|uniref:Secretion/DNA translocation related TadE-like protein n=1 Tax=Zhihengliuella flava TaxID=1285193 RepID=A0A931DB41_9MICC|nr:Rv3654c family TadE-like protein [Zhihengliuella flava]MBG6084161.1 secretion/DNA translocation related TadE-like protein [Zhihengliuella flava]
MTRFSDDAGGGTALGLALTAVLVLAAVSVLGVSHAAVVHQRTTTAADLAALAAADAARGLASGEPCAVAAAVAKWHGADLSECLQRGQIVDVTTSIPWAANLPLLDAAGLAAHVTARAGPPPAWGVDPSGDVRPN